MTGIAITGFQYPPTAFANCKKLMPMKMKKADAVSLRPILHSVSQYVDGGEDGAG